MTGGKTMILLDGNKQDVQSSGRRLDVPSRMTRGAECLSSTVLLFDTSTSKNIRIESLSRSNMLLDKAVALTTSGSGVAVGAGKLCLSRIF